MTSQSYALEHGRIVTRLRSLVDEAEAVADREPGRCGLLCSATAVRPRPGRTPGKERAAPVSVAASRMSAAARATGLGLGI